MATRSDPFAPGGKPDPTLTRLAPAPLLAETPGPIPAVAPVPSVVDLEPVDFEEIDEVRDDDAPLPEDPAESPAPPVVVLKPLTHLADVLHTLACGCAYGSDVEGHGVDFEALAVNVRGAVLTETVGAKHPIEAKVWAGAGGALAASLGLAFVTSLLDSLDVIDALGGGTSPWIGWLVLVLGMVLPSAGSLLRAYLADHTPRPADVLATAPAAVGSGVRSPQSPHALQSD